MKEGIRISGRAKVFAGFAVASSMGLSAFGVDSILADDAPNNPNAAQQEIGVGMPYRLVVPGLSKAEASIRTPTPEVIPPMPESGLDLYGGGEVVKLVNKIRKEHGLSELTYNSKLTLAAQRYSGVVMAKADFKNLTTASHTLDGQPYERAVREGYVWKKGPSPSEILGWHLASTREEYTDGVVHGWENSSPHVQNILNPVWKDIGGGCVTEWVPASRLPYRTGDTPIHIADCIVMFGAGEN